MAKPTLLFFGSFLHYSTKVLEGLAESKFFNIMGVVTTPRDSHTGIWANNHGLPVYAPETLNQASLESLPPVDYFVTAGYGKLLPESWLSAPRLTALNLHFSLLPKYRGANPAEWAILAGETETGITLIEMSPQFDTGKIIAQSAIPITPQDTRETVYNKLYSLGGEILPVMIEEYHKHPHSIEQGESPTPYARRFKRDDGFVSWSELIQGMNGTAPQEKIVEHERKVRALYGFPGMWTTVTTVKGEKRLKIHRASIENHKLKLELVQLEGYQPALFNQIKNQIQ